MDRENKEKKTKVPEGKEKTVELTSEDIQVSKKSVEIVTSFIDKLFHIKSK